MIRRPRMTGSAPPTGALLQPRRPHGDVLRLFTGMGGGKASETIETEYRKKAEGKWFKAISAARKLSVILVAALIQSLNSVQQRAILAEQNWGATRG